MSGACAVAAMVLLNTTKAATLCACACLASLLESLALHTSIAPCTALLMSALPLCSVIDQSELPMLSTVYESDFCRV